MGKLRAFRIFLNVDDVVFYPGDTVQGYCEVDIIGEIAVKCLTISLRGVSKIHWTESRNMGARLGPYTQHFMAGMEYIREKKVLTQPQTGADRVTLSEGKHDFPFTFLIPYGSMPSSFDGKYGSIRYWLRAEMTRTRFGHDKTKKAITLLNPLNVTLPEYQDKVESSADKTLCCGFCSGGLISITARTDKAGYSPGDTINVNAEFENFSSRRLYPYASLYQRQYYYANERQKMRTVRLVKFAGRYLSSKCNSTWTNEQLRIPNVTPSILNCSILKVIYFVKILVHIPGFMKLATTLPVTLGSSSLPIDRRTAVAPPLWLSPPPYEATDTSSNLPVYSFEQQVSEDDDDDDDDDYELRPPSSRNQTPPPAYSDIFDSEDSDSDDNEPATSGTTP